MQIKFAFFKKDAIYYHSVSLAAVRSKAVDLLLLIHSLLLLPLFVGVCVWSLLCYAVLSVLSSLAVILLRRVKAGCFTLVVYLVFCDC